MDFQGKTAFISGGSSGIGLALAHEFRKRGASLVLVARSQTRLDSAKAEILQTDSAPRQTVETISADVSDYASLKQSVDHYLQTHAAPDILVNGAGLVHTAKFINLSVAQYEEMIKVNYLGMVYFCKLIIPEMIKNHHGYVVNISSAGGLFPVYGYTGYAPTKYAVRGFSDCLRQEMRLLGINVSVVFPPDTQTPQLENEIPTRPIITQALAETNGVLRPEQVALEIVKGMEKKRYAILPGSEVKFLSKIANLAGFGIHPIIDLLTNYSIAKKKKEAIKKRTAK